MTTDLKCERCGEPAAVTIGTRSPWGSVVYYSHHCIEHAVQALKPPAAERKIIERQPGALARLTAIQAGMPLPPWSESSCDDRDYGESFCDTCRTGEEVNDG